MRAGRVKGSPSDHCKTTVLRPHIAVVRTRPRSRRYRTTRDGSDVQFSPIDRYLHSIEDSSQGSDDVETATQPSGTPEVVNSHTALVVSKHWILLLGLLEQYGKPHPASEQATFGNRRRKARPQTAAERGLPLRAEEARRPVQEPQVESGREPQNQGSVVAVEREPGTTARKREGDHHLREGRRPRWIVGCRSSRSLCGSAPRASSRC